MRKTLCLVPLALVVIISSVPALAGTEVALKRATGEMVARTTVAADGSFRFQDVAPDTYAIDVIVDGHVFASGSSGAAAPSGRASAADSWNGQLSIKSPRDVATGQASGKRTHNPVRFVKEWGAATPKLSVAVDGSTVSGTVVLATRPSSSPTH